MYTNITLFKQILVKASSFKNNLLKQIFTMSHLINKCVLFYRKEYAFLQVTSTPSRGFTADKLTGMQVIEKPFFYKKWDFTRKRFCLRNRSVFLLNKFMSFRKNKVSASLVQDNSGDANPLKKSGRGNAFSTRRYVITGSQRISNYWWASVISLGGLAFLLTGFAAFLNKSVLFFNQSRNISFLPQGLIMCFYGSLGLLFGIYLWCTIFWGVGNGFNEFNKEQGIIRIFRWGLPGKNRRIDLVYKIEQVERVRVELTEGLNPRRTISLRLKPDQKTRVPLISDTPRKKSNQTASKESTATAATSSKKTPLSESSSSPDSGKRLRNGSSSPDEKSFKGGVSQNSSSYAKQFDKQTPKDGTLLNSDIPLTRIGQPIGLEDIESEASELARFLQVPLDSFYEL